MLRDDTASNPESTNPDQQKTTAAEGVFASLQIILEFTINNDPVTLEPNYSLHAVPYIQDRRLLSDLSVNRNFIMDSNREFLNFFTASGSENILAVIKTWVKNPTLQIGDNQYISTNYGVINGTHGCTFPEFVREFKHDEFNGFLSYIILLLSHKIGLNRTDQLAFLEEHYGLKLTPGIETFKLQILRSRHPAYQRIENLEGYLSNRRMQENLPEPSENNIYSHITSLTSWLSNSLPTFGSTAAAASTQEIIDTSSVAPKVAGSEQERIDIITRLRADAYENIQAQKQDLKRLCELRSYFTPNEEYYKLLSTASSRIASFWNTINKPDSWQNPSVITQARKHAIDALIITDSILADMELFLREAGEEPTASKMAHLLTNQRYQFCRSFLYTGIIDFYAFYREHGWQTAHGYNRANESVADELFFRAGTAENDIRKLYNTFIKHGFDLRYGNVENGINNYRAELTSIDNRFGMWTSRDSKYTVPAAESLTQRVIRAATGEEAPTETKYTYTHPVNSTRPT